MRIALLTHQWPGLRMGGIGAYTAAAAEGLAAIGHEVHVFTFTVPPEVRSAVPSAVHFHEVADLAQRVQENALPGPLAAAVHAGGEGLYRLALAALLAAAVRGVHAKTPFDVVEGPEYEALALPLILDPLPGVAIITQLHSGSAINRLGNDRPAGPDDLLIEALEAAATLGAHARCAPSQRVLDLTAQFTPVPRPAEVIPLPVPSSTGVPPVVRGMGVPPVVRGMAVPPVLHPRPGASDEPAPIVFAGRLERLKGADLLALALPRFLTACPSARMQIIGPDTPTAPGGKSMRQWMLHQIPDPLRPRVDFTGELPPAQVREAISASLFVVIPSLYESFSLICAAAMAAGRTAVVSDGIGTTELLGDAGVTFQRGNAEALADALINLHNNPAQLAALSTKAHQRAKEMLDPEIVSHRRTSFYEQALAAARATAGQPDPLAQLPPSYAAALARALGQIASFLAGVPSPAIVTPGLRLLRILDSLGPHTHVLLYGAGRHTARLLAEKHLWESHGHAIVGLLDDHPRFAPGGTYLNLPVQSVAATVAHAHAGNPIPPIILSTDTFQDQFWSQTAPLRALGVPVFRLY